MSRIIWRRVRSEWLGRLTKGGPDRFAVVKVIYRGRPAWKVTDLSNQRIGLYERLRFAKNAAEMMRTPCALFSPP